MEVYQRPHDPLRPVVCLDETSKQMIIETRPPVPAAPGRKVRHDYEYERNGVAHLFMMFAPLEGWRHVKVTDRHAAIDYAHTLKDLSDTHFPGAVKIVLVQDNLSTHTAASLYAAFPAAEARRLSRAVRMALHAKTRQLARYGGVRTRRSRDPMPRPPHSRQVDVDRGSRRLAEQAKQASRQSRLAIHNRRRSRQAKKTIPSVPMTLATSHLNLKFAA